MLIAQNADGSSITQQSDRLFETFFTIKHLDASAAANATYVFVNVPVAEPLIDGAISDVANVFGQNVSE
jgi:hypothetical protein